MKFKHRGKSQDLHENETLSKEMILKETFANKGRTNSKTEESSTHEQTVAALRKPISMEFNLFYFIYFDTTFVQYIYDIITTK